MSYRRISSLTDMVQAQRNCRIECGCGRAVIFTPFQLICWFGIHGWKTDIGSVQHHMRCQCGQREPQIGSTDEPPNASLIRTAIKKAETITERAQAYRNFAAKFGNPTARKLEGDDLKRARVCWANRHGSFVQAMAEYQRTFGVEGDEYTVRMVTRDAKAHLTPGAFYESHPGTQTNEGEEALIRLYGYRDRHELRLWWDKQPMEWRERMNGVDRESLFEPGEVDQSAFR